MWKKGRRRGRRNIALLGMLSLVFETNLKYKAALCLKSLTISMFLIYVLFATEIPK